MTDLTIAIPTYNRSKRLQKCLSDLFNQILESGFFEKIEVLISDNASEDDTFYVINSSEELYSKNNIKFKHISNPINLGFGENVKKCYECAEGKYVWFLSDDDNLYAESIKFVLDRIENEKPNTLFFNFNQTPYNNNNPRIKEEVFLPYIGNLNSKQLRTFTNWPKLSACVIKKYPINIGSQIDKKFTHVSIFLLIAIKYGNVMFCSDFVAFADDDFQDHIDFSPYIGNELNKELKELLFMLDKEEFYSNLSISHVDPLGSSLQMLGTYYRGNFSMHRLLKEELYETIRREIRRLTVKKIFSMSLSLSFLKFIFSIIYFCFFYIFTGKKITIDRD